MEMAKHKRIIHNDLNNFYKQNSKHCFSYKREVADTLKNQVKERRKSIYKTENAFMYGSVSQLKLGLEAPDCS